MEKYVSSDVTVKQYLELEEERGKERPATFFWQELKRV